MKQYRIVGLGDYDNYLSYFTLGIMEGSIWARHLFRPVPFFGHPLETVKKQILWFKPHILIAHMLFGCSSYHRQDHVFDMLRELRKAGIFVVYHNGDARKDPRYPGDISDIVDLGLLNQSRLEHYENIWKIPVIRWPYACLYQAEISKEKSEVFKCNIAFTGGLASSGVHKERTDFIHKLIDAGMQVKIFPTQESGNTRFQTAELAAIADSVFGMQMARDIDGYLDVRPFQYIGAGALYFHDKCDQMHEYFEPMRHYVEYDRNDPQNVIDLWKHFKVNWFEAQSIREEGFKLCQREHSTKKRVEKIVEKYEEMRG